jgi:hypothetical protein
MAVNNDFKYAPTNGNNWYVSAHYGDDLNPGTNLLPFKTKAKAELSGSNGDNIIIGSGYYTEQASVSLNTYRYYGEGLVIIAQPVAPTLPALNINTEYVEGIAFFGWTNAVGVIQHRSTTPGNLFPIFANCQFIESRIRAGLDSSFGYYMACVFDTIEFDSTGDPDPSPNAGGISNCIFRECTGVLPALQDYEKGVYSNHFVESDTLMIGIGGGQPIEKFDYNNIEGGLNGYPDNATIQGLGFNTNGSSELSTNVFNDFGILRPTTEWYKQDYTQKATSPLLVSSKTGGPVTRYNEGIRYDAAFIEGTNSGIDQITLVGDQLQLNALQSEGFVINEYDIGSVRKINLISLLQEIGWNVTTGQGEQLADHLEDIMGDIKATYDIEVKHKKELLDAFEATVVEYNKYIVDRSPQSIEARFLEITLTLRDYTI